MAGSQTFRVRAASIFVESVKLGTAYDSDYTRDSGDEIAFADEGFVGFTSGAESASLETSLIVPVTGLAFDLDNCITNKLPVNIIMNIGDAFHRVIMRVKTARRKSEQKSGTLVGTFQFIGGPALVIPGAAIGPPKPST